MSPTPWRGAGGRSRRSSRGGFRVAGSRRRGGDCPALLLPSGQRQQAAMASGFDGARNVHADTLQGRARANAEGIACIQTLPNTWPDQDRLYPTIPPQPTPWCTLSQLPTDCVKPAGVHRSGYRSLSSRGTAKSRRRASYRRGDHGMQTRRARAADQGIERHARLQSAEPVDLLGRRWCRSRVRVDCLSVVLSVARSAGWSAHQAHSGGWLQLHCQTTGSDHHGHGRAQRGPRRRAPCAA
jgi:hypothetical protein